VRVSALRMCVAITSPYPWDRGVTMSFEKIGFPIEKSKFGKIQVLVFGKIYITQKWFKKFEICVEIFHTSLYINVS